MRARTIVCPSVVLFVLTLSCIAAQAQITIDDHVRRARIMLASISPDGSTAAYLVARANPLEDVYDLSLLTVDASGKSAPVTLAEFQLTPSEAIGVDSGSFLLSGADLQWVSDGELLFTRRVAGKAQLELWSRSDKSLRAIMSGHDRIGLGTEPGTGKIILTTTDFVPRPETPGRAADNSLRMVDGYRFYGPAENPKLGRRLRTQRWTLSFDGNPVATPQGDPSENWETKPDEFILPPSRALGVAEASATEQISRYGLKKSPDGTMTVAQERASSTVSSNAPPSVGLGLEENGAWRTIVPRDPSLIFISVIGWRSDSKAVFYTVLGQQGTSINMVSLDGKITSLHSETGSLGMPYGSFGRDNPAIGRDGRTVLMVRSTNLTPDELVKVDLQSGTVTQLAAPNADFKQRADAIVRFYPLPAAGEQVWGRLFLPRDTDRRKPVPLLIIQYFSTPGYELTGVGDEVAVLPLVDAGVAVFAMHSGNLNNTSKAGDFRPEINRLERPLRGMEAIVRQLAAEGRIDPQRVGLWGLSYGAEISAYAMWKSPLFKAVGLASASWDPSLMEFGGLEWEKLMKNRGFSSVDAEDPKTWRILSLGLNAKPGLPPLLIQSGDRERNYTAPTWTRLRSAGAPIEWFEYPNEGHTKKGPANKWWVFQRNLDWFRFWLQGYEDPDPSKAEQYLRWRQMRDRAASQRTAGQEAPTSTSSRKTKLRLSK